MLLFFGASNLNLSTEIGGIIDGNVGVPQNAKEDGDPKSENEDVAD